MIRHVFKIIWNERKSNGWLVLEYILVFCILWFCCDYLYFITKRLVEPLGYDIEHTYKVNMGYRSDEEFLKTFDEDAQPSVYDMTMDFVDRIKRYPGVENVSVSNCALPFGGNSTASSFNIINSDSSYVYTWMGSVDPAFFDVFRIDIQKGEVFNWPDPAASGRQALIAPSANEEFGAYNVFDVHSVGGSWGESEHAIQVLGVINKIKRQHYSAYTSVILQPLKPDQMNLEELVLRVSPVEDRDFAERFTEDMKERLTMGRHFLSSVESMKDYRKSSFWGWDNLDKDIKSVYIIVGFLLVNIFLGIIGTFWFRTQARRSEVGLRIAMGASKRKVKGMLITESMLLLVISALAGVIVCLNIGQTDLIQTLGLPAPHRESYEMTPWNNVINFGITFLFLAIVSIAGVWYPARRASGVQPAEALHDE